MVHNSWLDEAQKLEDKLGEKLGKKLGEELGKKLEEELGKNLEEELGRRSWGRNWRRSTESSWSFSDLGLLLDPESSFGCTRSLGGGGKFMMRC